jgi:hypothetical protein
MKVARPPSARKEEGSAMGPKMTTWRASLWARWLGWTVVFGLVAAASVVANSAVRSAFPSVAGAELVVPCSVAAFLIGLRIRSWWWLAGPAVVVMVLFVAAGLTSRELAAAFRDAQSVVESSGMSVFIYALLLLMYALVTFVGGALLFAIPALLGVWWGKRREAGDVGSTKNSLGSDAST